MRFQLDHDYHIHSQLSLCSNDPNQNTENILHIAENLGLRQICLADHIPHIVKESCEHFLPPSLFLSETVYHEFHFVVYFAIRRLRRRGCDLSACPLSGQMRV